MCSQMPLPNHGGLVACSLEQFWEGLLSAIEFVSVAAETVDVRVLAGLYNRPHRTTNAVSYVTSIESKPLPSKPIDVGRLIYF